MMTTNEMIAAAHVAILLYLDNGTWQTKGWIRRKLQNDGYQIDPVGYDWLMTVLDELVREHKLYHRKWGLYHEYRLVELSKEGAPCHSKNA